MKLRRRTYVSLVFAVIVSVAATSSLAPKRKAETSCRVGTITLAVEVCPPSDVKTILGEIGSSVRGELHDQTLADFALIASYVGLWGATALALHPGVALVAAGAGAADVIENFAILHELPLSDPLPLVRWASLTKWGLLGLVFIAFAFLLRPHRVSGRWPSLLRAATGLAYGVAGAACLAGLVDLRLIEWAIRPLVAAVFLQLVLHVTAHGEFEAVRARRFASRDPSAARLPVETVLAEEFECLHRPLKAPTNGGLGPLYEAIHGLAEKRSAVCLSGGGIRSATFALGVLQGLATIKILPQFHYLSTVSGGGYIGGWLTAWLHHSGNDVAAVAHSLATLDSTHKIDPEPSPVSHLRDYSNYLAPRPGLLSADTWTLAGTILRNLILVWLVLVPLLVAGLTVPRLYLALIQAAPALDQASVSGRYILGLGGLALAWAVAYIGASIPNSTTALRSQGRFLRLCLLPLVISILCLTLYWAWWPTRVPKHFVLFGVVVHLVAWAGYTIWLQTRWGLARPSPKSRVQAALAELIIVVVAGAAAGYIAWFVATVLLDDDGKLGRFKLIYACLAPGVFLGAFLLAATLLVGFLSRWTEDEDREWWARSGAWMLITGVVWLVMSPLVLFGPLLFSGPVVGSLLASVGGVSGLIGLVGGWSARSAGGPAASSPGSASKLNRLGLPAAAAIFAAVLVLAVSLVTSGLLGWLMGRFKEFALSSGFLVQWPSVPDGLLGHVPVLLTSSPLLVLAVGTGLALVGSVAALLVNTNKFSLHAMYRARLIRAYLGASNLGRNGNPFTGFDETDNIQMHALWPRSSAAAASDPPSTRRALFHVVNTALNLVHDDRLAWQERKAHSFTVSPLHAGSVAAGEPDRKDGAYRRTRASSGGPRANYGGADGISLGTAITISGAAASPNMGYHSSPLVTFLMTLFNARLGWWLGNPGPPGEDTYYLPSPRFSVRPIVAEAFGLTDRTSPYVYLSDGGHFENLGLYEMVLRRCHFIVVSDASCDGTCGLNDLGGAIRKIRADFGIPIDFPSGISIYPRSADPATRARGLYWAVGRIRYSVVDPPATPADPAQAAAARDARDGWLLYVKPAFYGSEPADVYEYATANDQFPHESTVDQFFTESQFESYRMLGVHAITRLGDGWTGGSLADLMRHANTRR